jgi:acyl-CoA reductase-like NAD-dependent aldehyde dehydrogenase
MIAGRPVGLAESLSLHFAEFAAAGSKEVQAMSAATKLREYASHPFAPAAGTPPPSSPSQIDAAIARLREGASTFAALSLEERLALASAMQRGYLQVAERTVAADCRAKGIAQGTPAEAEAWATGPWPVVRQLRLIRESLASIRRSGNTPIGRVSATPDGCLSVRVFPGNAIDAMLFRNVTVDVHMQQGVSEATLGATRARFYKHPGHDGRVVLVLGAGNIAAIGAMDIVSKMFNEGKVCVLKMNPVNAYLGPLIEEAFAAAIRRDFLAVTYGGAEQGRYLVYHDGIDEVHITGSDKTHDQIVWGPPGPEQKERKRRNEPLLNKPITSELGNISPVIVVPGPYSDKELRFQAEDAASYLVMNGSFLCNAANMLVMPNGWAGSDAFLRHVQEVCAAVPPRRAYYPGAEDRWQALTAGRAQVKHIGGRAPGVLPWTFITGLDPAASNEPLYVGEPFCPVLPEVRLGSADPVEFLDRAVDFTNDRLWGTLAATLVVHPKSLREPAVHAAVERAVARLRYGTVTINGYSGLSFVFAAPPWGAHAGATLDNVQSGRGFVHNTAMLEGIEKVVMRCPLTTFPKPGYFPSHRTAHAVMRRLVALEESASWSKVPGVVLAAMRA